MPYSLRTAKSVGSMLAGSVPALIPGGLMVQPLNACGRIPGSLAAARHTRELATNNAVISFLMVTLISLGPGYSLLVPLREQTAPSLQLPIYSFTKLSRLAGV